MHRGHSRQGAGVAVGMKTGMYARMLFGASAVLYGAVPLMWRDFTTWQPFGSNIGVALAIAQIAGGIGLLYPRTARSAAVVLGVVFLLLSLVCIPGMVASPAIYQSYGSFFEPFSLLCGAIAVYASFERAAQSAVLRRVVRIGLGLCVLSFALEQKFYLHQTAVLVPVWIAPNQLFWAIVTTVAFALAAVAILANRQARLALRLTALMTAIFGVLVWIPRLVAQPHAEGNWSEFALTFLITGAAWLAASIAR